MVQHELQTNQKRNGKEKKMKQALILMKEINRKREAIKNSKSEHLKHDYKTRIKRDLQELKEYCGYKGLDYKAVTGERTYD